MLTTARPFVIRKPFRPVDTLALLILYNLVYINIIYKNWIYVV